AAVHRRSPGAEPLRIVAQALRAVAMETGQRRVVRYGVPGPSVAARSRWRDSVAASQAPVTQPTRGVGAPGSCHARQSAGAWAAARVSAVGVSTSAPHRTGAAV